MSSWWPAVKKGSRPGCTEAARNAGGMKSASADMNAHACARVIDIRSFCATAFILSCGLKSAAPVPESACRVSYEWPQRKGGHPLIWALLV